MASEEQYDEFAKRMHERFPEMFKMPYGGFCIGEGWWPIVESLCGNIQHYLDWINKNRETRPIVEQVVVMQIKEKFGGLRFYYEGGDEKVYGMVRMAESWADHTCEDCGNKATKKTTGWIKNLCNTHFEQREAVRKERFKE